MVVKEPLSEPESGATSCGKGAFMAWPMRDMNAVEAAKINQVLEHWYLVWMFLEGTLMKLLLRHQRAMNVFSGRVQRFL